MNGLAEDALHPDEQILRLRRGERAPGLEAFLS